MQYANNNMQHADLNMQYADLNMQYAKLHLANMQYAICLAPARKNCRKSAWILMYS